MTAHKDLARRTTQRSATLVESPLAGKRGTAAPFRALVIGALADVPRTLEHPAIGSRSRFDVVCVVPLAEDDPHISRSVICELVAENAADTILVAGPISRTAVDELGEIAVTVGCRLLVVMPAPVPRLHDPVIVWEGEHPLIQLAVVQEHGVQNVLKRLFDVVVSTLALITTAPVVAVAAVAVMATSRGGAFFGHERVGRGGRRFQCWKIRTMAANAEEQLRSNPALQESYRNNNFKLPERSDPRVTRVGRFLRQTSIDELPQLWNVLKGHMSLVGPRPLIADELHHYAGSVLTLLSVRPGLTGAWAVNGRHRLHYPRRAEIELDYVRNCSLRTDMVIIFRTAAAVVDFNTDDLPVNTDVR